VSTDPVAWFVIEPGWETLAADGGKLGAVKGVFGDENADIFDGLLLGAGVTRDRYVPAERVTAIYTGRIETDLAEAELDGLEATAPGSVRALVR
jgi:hypothetical protein